MKKVFFIGKFNKTFEKMHYALRGYFNIQICVPNYEMVKGMLALNQPDLVLISMVDMNRESIGVFEEIYQNYSQIPVVCFGSKNEQMHFEEFMYRSQFHMLTRPIESEALLEEMCRVLGLCYDAENKTVDGEERKLKCVMLVDDNAFQIRVLSSILKERYDVQLATSGLDVIEMIQKRKPDLIFLDYEMPECDGRMTLQMIRESEEGKDIPVVYLTSVRDRGHIEAVLEFEPAGYLLKPANAEKIFAITDKLLEKKE